MRTQNGPTIAAIIAVVAYMLIGLAACSGAMPLRPAQGEPAAQVRAISSYDSAPAHLSPLQVDRADHPQR